MITATKRSGQTMPKYHVWDGFECWQDKRIHEARCTHCGHLFGVPRSRWSATTFARLLAKHTCSGPVVIGGFGR